MITPELERKIFLALLLIVTIAFVAILMPFYGAVFWGMILALLFNPLQRRLVRRFSGRNNLAALATLGVVMVIVIIPVAVIATSLVAEASAIYQRINTGQFNVGDYFQKILGLLPQWLLSLLERLGLNDLGLVQTKLAAGAAAGSQFVATQAISIGQNTFEFVIGFGVMLYLLFFLLRDGKDLSVRILEAIPLNEHHKRKLMGKFTTVVRATVKGNVVVAATQGALGGLIFWILGVEGVVLWSVIMAFLSLLPAVGAALIWGPVALYFLATGALVQGFVLIAYGIVVIGLVDNVLRPVLVGKDTKMPDYVVLISTLGGMALFGINGFVIGPVIAALFIAAWDLCTSGDNDDTPEFPLAAVEAPMPEADTGPDTEINTEINTEIGPEMDREPAPPVRPAR
ncbi:MAG: AI-2E family transporter [Rubrivivax sp.]|nr:MAG: AI-2E family transporter [Rubrivivax sp.]